MGATVTVESAVYKKVDIEVAIVPEPDYSIEDVQKEIENKVKSFFKEIAFTESIVRLSKINNIVFNAESVSDYADVKINGDTKNLELKDEDIPKLGTVTILEQD